MKKIVNIFVILSILLLGYYYYGDKLLSSDEIMTVECTEEYSTELNLMDIDCTVSDPNSIISDTNSLTITLYDTEDVIVEEPVAPAAPVEPAQDTTAMVAELKADFAAQKSQLETKIAELESKVKEGFAQVAELVEALSNTPTAEPTQKAANAFQSYVTTNDSKYERLEKYRNAILNK